MVIVSLDNNLTKYIIESHRTNASLIIFLKQHAITFYSVVGHNLRFATCTMNINYCFHAEFKVNIQLIQNLQVRMTASKTKQIQKLKTGAAIDVTCFREKKNKNETNSG